LHGKFAHYFRKVNRLIKGQRGEIGQGRRKKKKGSGERFIKRRLGDGRKERTFIAKRRVRIKGVCEKRFRGLNMEKNDLGRRLYILR